MKYIIIFFHLLLIISSTHAWVNPEIHIVGRVAKIKGDKIYIFREDVGKIVQVPRSSIPQKYQIYQGNRVEAYMNIVDIPGGKKFYEDMQKKLKKEFKDQL